MYAASSAHSPSDFLSWRHLRRHLQRPLITHNSRYASPFANPATTFNSEPPRLSAHYTCPHTTPPPPRSAPPDTFSRVVPTRPRNLGENSESRMEYLPEKAHFKHLGRRRSQNCSKCLLHALVRSILCIIYPYLSKREQFDLRETPWIHIVTVIQTVTNTICVVEGNLE